MTFDDTESPLTLIVKSNREEPHSVMACVICLKIKYQLLADKFICNCLSARACILCVTMPVCVSFSEGEDKRYVFRSGEGVREKES